MSGYTELNGKQFWSKFGKNFKKAGMVISFPEYVYAYAHVIR